MDPRRDRRHLHRLAGQSLDRQPRQPDRSRGRERCGGAAGDRVRFRWQCRRCLGRPHCASRWHPRLLRRLSGQCLDRRQWRWHREKYSRAGTLLLQIGKRGVCDNPADERLRQLGSRSVGQPEPHVSQRACGHVHRPVTRPGHEESVAASTSRTDTATTASSYSTSRGEYLRQWGSVAGTVNDPVRDFPDLFGAGDGGHPHCVVIGRDDLVYVCDRPGRPDSGVHEGGCAGHVIPVVPGTGVTLGSRRRSWARHCRLAWDLDFSRDRDQT